MASESLDYSTEEEDEHYYSDKLDRVLKMYEEVATREHYYIFI